MILLPTGGVTIYYRGRGLLGWYLYPQVFVYRPHRRCGYRIWVLAVCPHHYTSPYKLNMSAHPLTLHEFCDQPCCLVIAQLCNESLQAGSLFINSMSPSVKSYCVDAQTDKNQYPWCLLAWYRLCKYKICLSLTVGKVKNILTEKCLSWL